ncbi:MAG: phage integrase SAM-like domain-containing protein [Alistipes sp.]|uniref:phage integrase SAM-like domain-containing protein n=1 Tax=Alistipes TaxID=239759 RepID=UPI003992A054
MVSEACFITGTYRSIEEFAGSNIPFENVMVNWLKKYEKWLLDNGKSYATVGFCPFV